MSAPKLVLEDFILWLTQHGVGHVGTYRSLVSNPLRRYLREQDARVAGVGRFSIIYVEKEEEDRQFLERELPKWAQQLMWALWRAGGTTEKPEITADAVLTLLKPSLITYHVHAKAPVRRPAQKTPVTGKAKQGQAKENRGVARKPARSNRVT